MEHLLLHLEVRPELPNKLDFKMKGEGHEIAQMVIQAMMETNNPAIANIFVTAVFEVFHKKNVSAKTIQAFYEQHKTM